MRLLIITQKVDSEDSVLGFFHTWITEFSKHCESVKVICLYKGKSDLPKNVEVFSLGKESGTGTFYQIVNLFKHLFRIKNSFDHVFVHMNPIYLVLCGWYFKIKGIPMYLWYVHRSVDLKLRIAVMFVNKVFSSVPESFRLQTKKVIFLGHGINVDILPNTPHVYDGSILKIVHIGRITQIKHIETAIEAIYNLKKIGIDSELTLFGKCETEVDEVYKEKLKVLVVEKNLEKSVDFAGAILHDDLSVRLKSSHLSVNMTPPGGMDKAVLEAILLGMPTFSSNSAFTKLFDNYKDIFLFKYKDAVDLSEKIRVFVSNKNNQHIIDELNIKVRENYSLDKLVKKIFAHMMEKV